MKNSSFEKKRDYNSFNQTSGNLYTFLLLWHMEPLEIYFLVQGLDGGLGAPERS